MGPPHAKVGPRRGDNPPPKRRVAALGPGSAAADLSFLAPSSEPGALGRLDHYEVLEVVGQGGTGVVLRARDTKLLRVVAIKALAAPLAASGTARQRFAREARAAAGGRMVRLARTTRWPISTGPLAAPGAPAVRAETAARAALPWVAASSWVSPPPT